jgi:sugar transferase (PEP-CTERM/EpsH1 system associated)
MNILFIAPYVPSLIRVRPYHFVRQLSLRHAVTLLAVGSAEDPALAELRRCCERVEVVPPSLLAATPGLARAAVRREPLQASVSLSPSVRERLVHLVTTEQFDVAHIEHLRAARLHTHLPAGTPRVFDSVDSISLLLERTLRASHSVRQRLLARFELAPTRRYEAELARAFQGVVVTSPDDAAAIKRLQPRARVSVIPNGVDLERFSPLGAPSLPPTIVFSGKMSYHANVSAVLHFVRDIWPSVRARRPDARLRIVGSRPPREIAALAADPSITVTGHVADVRAAVSGASLAVCPVTVKVGIQNKVLESMALGLPVVCTRAGAEGIAAVPDHDFVVTSGQTEFAEAVLRILDDPAMGRTLGRHGRQYVERHHRWEVATAHLEQVYGQLVTNLPRRAA